MTPEVIEPINTMVLILAILGMSIIIGFALYAGGLFFKPKKSRKSKIGAGVRTYQDEDGIWRTEVEEEEKDDDECEEDDCR